MVAIMLLTEDANKAVIAETIYGTAANGELLSFLQNEEITLFGRVIDMPTSDDGLSSSLIAVLAVGITQTLPAAGVWFCPPQR